MTTYSNAMKMTVELDASNRILLSNELHRAAGIARKQKLLASATPGRIVLAIEPNTSGRIIKRGKLKVWTGAVPTTSIEEAVDQSRHNNYGPHTAAEAAAAEAASSLRCFWAIAGQVLFPGLRSVAIVASPLPKPWCYRSVQRFMFSLRL
jgi:hypothetical protein